jgi:hypothetical protein
MTARTWIRKMFESRRPRTVRKAPARRCLSLETLEDRAVPTVSFGPAVAYGTGGPSPHSVAVGDFTGHVDLVALDPGSESLSLLTINANGTLNGAQISSTGYSSASMATGNFDNGTFLDVATADPSINAIGMALGTSGGFQFHPYSVNVGAAPTYMATGDFFGTNVPGLVVVNSNAGTVTALDCDNAGDFLSYGNSANTGPLPVAVAVGDFNGDGNLDVVTANSANKTVSVLFGNGNGTFQTAVSYAVGSSPSSVAVGDLNGDGKPDIVVTDAGGNSVSVLMNNGNGTFQPAVNYAVGVDPTSVAVGDFNHDGKLDVVAANTGSNSVSVLQGNGNGTFQPAVNYAVGSLPTSVAVADLNGDGFPDLVTANSGDGTVSVLLNTSALSISSNQNAVTTNEGTKVTNTGSFNDFYGNATVTLKASTGTVTKNTADTGWTWSYTPTVGLAAPKTVTITATDTNGDTATTSFTLTVNYVAPTITTFSVPTSATEGSLVPLSGAATEPAGTNDPLTYTWTVYNPNGTVSKLTGANASFTPPDNGSYGVDLTVTDSGGLSTSEDLRASLTNLYRGEGNANNTIGAGNGTAVGGVTYVAGKVGEAFSFNGTTGVVDLPNNILPVPTSGTSTTPFSFDTWFKTTTGGVILGQAGLGSAGGYVPSVYVGTDGKLYAELGWDGAGNPVVSTGTVNNGQWHNVAVTYNGTSETVYLDGAAVATVPFVETAFNSSGYSYTLGSGMASSTDGWPAAPSPSHDLYYFKGQIDEAAFYSSALSAGQVQTIFNTGNFTPITVTNVAPTPALTGFTTGLATEQLTYKLSATDPSPADTAAGFTYKISWGDGSAAQTITPTANNGTGVSVTHDFPTVGTYTVSLTATDKDGGATTITEKVTILPVTSANLQTVITQQGSVTFQETSDALAQTLVSAVNGLAAQTKPVTITMNLGSANYTDLTPSPKAGITLVISGSGGTTTVVGHSPALHVASGNVVIENLTLVTDTNSPTVMVSGGSLMLRNVDVEGTGTGSQPAVWISGGNVDLGTATDPGGNTFDVHGHGGLIHNSGSNGVNAMGDTWELDGTVMTSMYRVQDRMFDSLDGGGGMVTYVWNNVYVSADGGDIQSGVDAVAPGGTVNVEAGGRYHNYIVGSKLITIAFQSGPVLTQAADPQNLGLLNLSVVGTPGNDKILFNLGGKNGTVNALVDNLPQGTFNATGQLIAYGLAGNDDMEVARGVTLPAFLYGGAGNDYLQGGGGNDVLVGGAGRNDLIAGPGRDLLISGSGSSTLNAGSGDDLLIAGSTAFDANQVALDAIMAEWTSSRSYATRIADLSGASTGPRSNGNYFLIASGPKATVFGNNATDVVDGGSGSDWFFVDLARDILRGVRKGEIVEDL